MGMGEPAVFVDGQIELSCPRGHTLRAFHTRDLAGLAITTYLVHGNRLYLAEARDGHAPAPGPEVWRIEPSAAVREHRFTLREVTGSRTVRIHATCPVCDRSHADPRRRFTTEPGSTADLVNACGTPLDNRQTPLDNRQTPLDNRLMPVDSRQMPVRFRLTFRTGEPLRIERMPALQVVTSRQLM